MMRVLDEPGELHMLSRELLPCLQRMDGTYLEVDLNGLTCWTHVRRR
ncbi:hypothetical protein FHT28_006942 [Rhizobium sp. SG570]|nr:hypothetical protein [Rhizobium sp. SG570]